MTKPATNKKLLGKGGVFLFANILNAAILFFLIPVLTRILSPEDYGTVAMFSTYLSLATTLVGFSVHGAINVQYFKLEKERFAQYVTNCLLILTVSATLIALLVSLLGQYLEPTLGFSKKWMLIGIATAFFQFLTTIKLVLWVVAGSAKSYGALQVSQTFTNAALSIFLILTIGLTWDGRALGQVASVILFGLISVVLLIKTGIIVRPRNIKADTKDALSFGIPLIPHAVGGFAMASTDRLVISNLMDISAVGLYMIGLQLGQVMGILADSFNKVYSPWIYRNLSLNDIDKIKLVKNSYAMMMAFLLIGLLWSGAATLALPFLVGEKFQTEKSVILYMCMGHAFTALYYIVTNYVFYAEKTRILASITLITALINAPLTYYLVEWNGLDGAALAFLIVQIGLFAFTWLLSNKVFPMPWLYFIKGNANA